MAVEFLDPLGSRRKAEHNIPGGIFWLDLVFRTWNARACGACVLCGGSASALRAARRWRVTRRGRLISATLGDVRGRRGMGAHACAFLATRSHPQFPHPHCLEVATDLTRKRHILSERAPGLRGSRGSEVNQHEHGADPLPARSSESDRPVHDAAHVA
jgi:hypothetical protein